MNNDFRLSPEESLATRSITGLFYNREFFKTHPVNKFWLGIRDSAGEVRNPNWYTGMWETAWREYIILASEALKEDD